MAFQCNERDLKTCKELNRLGLCEIHTNKKGKKSCRRVPGARNITLDDIATIRGVTKTTASASNVATVVASATTASATASATVATAATAASANAIQTIVNSPIVIKTKSPSVPIKPLSQRVKTPSPLKPGSPVLEQDSILATGIHHTLVEPIFNLTSRPRESIDTILNNLYLKQNYGEFISMIREDTINDAIDFYEKIQSNNFRELLNSLFIQYPEFAKDLQVRILDILNNPNITTKAGPLMYRAIYNITMEKLEPISGNTSIVLKTAKNVQTVEDIESLGINTYAAILRNFSEFRYYNKSSVSNSIILTASLTPNAENVNSIKSRRTLRAGQRFYFKVFPLGDVVTDGKLIQYDTVGLVTEYKVYTELFKLVKYNVTPNILCKISADEMPYFNSGFIDRIPSELRAVLKGEMGRINKVLGVKSTDSWDRTGLVVTMPGGSAVSDMFISLTPVERKKIMFQYLYTLYIFDKLQISHGDLHTSNMFIIDVEPTELCYLIDGIQYRFMTTKILKIYDFDHAMIAKDTNIRVDINGNFRVNITENPDRATGEFFNTKYGECSIYNKNLDLIISIVNGFAFSISDLTTLNITNGKDVEIEEFFRDILPGMNNKNPVCHETIRETYRKEFTDVKNIRDAQTIFNMPFDKMANWVGDDILDMTWSEYFNKTKKTLGRIVKSFTKVVNDNHLWVPNSVIISKDDMLKHQYFRELISTAPINVRNNIVYTIDNRI